MVMTAMINDATALLTHVDRLDGRSAAHCARAMFEHSVNALDLENSPINSSGRFLDHSAVTDYQVSRRRWYLRLLTAPARAKEKRKLDRLERETAPVLKRALKNYGPSFRKGWAAGTLFDRARAHGLESDYEAYRIFSAVIHGSSGGMTGTARSIRGRSVFRLGPDLNLTAMAFVEGVNTALKYFERLETQTDRPEAVQIRVATERLLAHTETVREELRRVDSLLWPATPVPPPAAVLAIYRGGKERWFQYLPAAGTLQAAQPPSVLSRSAQESLDEVRAAVAAGRSGDHEDPTTVLVPGIPLLEPKPNAKIFPADALMSNRTPASGERVPGPLER
ncbi:DUF5677 domain-containing protein [Microbacterium esteraromaticum]|uniref:DUF5677 domain-containing protein n=1 Tax=Microbacterium esteraromaticum TaxID=57043 RepID=UPI001C951881|nr:DUF5677 domain-containing protein [Microbacterium esteraromaticum]MBY6062211.1 hypothetical protein [Microbacterium esteraromaticum]